MSTFATVQALNAQQQAIPFNGGTNLLPGDKHPKAISQYYDFGATGIPAAGYSSDMSVFINSGAIKGIQTLFIDNSLNNGPVQISNLGFGQALSLPAGYQGYFPIIAALQSGNAFAVTSHGTGPCNIKYLNTLFPYGIWPALIAPPSSGAPQAVSDAILDATVIAGRQQVQAIEAPVVVSDASGQIAVANTSQVLFAANPARRGYQVQNIDPTYPEALWVCETGAAVVGGPGSYGLAQMSSAGYPGGSLTGSGTGQIQIIATSAGHKFTATQW